ncbi:spore coat protein SP85-like [Anthonomus grandis grandis]|uniref:spore coat protein SP85-like n=1 Tax=Anthonomus grandis grandis TaxID=2921223 RepID=UPI00216554BC|nr:spore coat protein SP85-like [Anthonomus grandis grandis]
MNLQLFIFLLTATTLAQCCSSSGCYSSHCSSSCCQGTSNNCCKERQSLCCNQHVQSCCQDSCCENYFRQGCERCPPTNPCSSTTSRPPPPLPPMPPSPPSPPLPPLPPSPQPFAPTSNVNNNSIVIPTNITVQNEIHSETRIQVPVSVDVNNVNNINIHPADHENSHDHHNHTTTVINETVTVKIPVYVPIRIPIPIPYRPIIPTPPHPQPHGCCPVVQPCVPYSFAGCQQMSYQCSSTCMTSPVYQPMDVCGGGCMKRGLAVGSQCHMEGGCSTGLVNCGQCRNDFFESYEGFVRCSGCFVPMEWGAYGQGFV